MSQECRSCSRACELFLCSLCTQELRAQLVSLAHGPEVNGRVTAGLLEDLGDVVLKLTKLGDGGGHRKKGDEMPDPFEPDTEKGRQTAQGRASTLMHAANNTLSTIIRDLCESRGVSCPRGLPPSRMAEWLAAGVHSIACDESAGQWRSEVDQLVRQIQRAVDKPTPPKLWGRCLHKLDDGTDCATAIYGKRDAIQVVCPNRRCRAEYNADLLFQRNIKACDYMHFTREELIGNQRTEHADRYWTGFMGEMGEFVHYKQFQRWIKDGKLKPRRFRRATGRHGSYRRNEEDIPEYLLADVRRVRLGDSQVVAR